MPGGDGTGPAGMGPMTGRAAGFCAGYSVPGYMNPYGGRFGYGRGFGRGAGRGWRNWYRATGFPGWARAQYGLPAWGSSVGAPFVPPYVAPPEPQQELDVLKSQADHLSGTLDAIKARIEELEKADKS